MKTAVMATTGIVVAYLSITCRAGNDDRWYKPFAPEVGRRVENAVGTPTCIWFLNCRGVGRFFTATNTTDFYRFDSLKLLDYSGGYDMVAADSDHVALFDKTDGRLILFNGKTWYPMLMSGGYGDAAFAANGDLWIASGDTCLVRVVRNSGSPEFVSLGMPDSVHVSSLAFGEGGALWFVGRTVHAYPTGPDSAYSRSGRRLYRFDGTSSHEVAIDSEDPKLLDVDINGIVRFYGDSTVYSVGDDTARRAFTKPPDLTSTLLRSVSDADGNLWLTNYNAYSVTRIDARTATAWTDSILPMGLYTPLVACRDGVYCPRGNGFIHYPGNDTMSTVVTEESIWGDRCGDPDHILLFRRDGTMLAQTTQLSFTYPVIEYDHGRCRHHSSAPEVFARIIERLDGTLLACGALSRGLYRLLGETWEPLPGSEHFTLLSGYGEDGDGKIWGVLDGAVVHQTSDGWETINASNSDLPSFGFSGVNEFQPVVNDDAGNVWMQLDSLVVKTSDGRHWTVFDKKSLGLRSGRPIRLFERKGTVVATGFAGCDSTGCSEVIRCVWNGSDWQFDTLRLPFSVSASGYYFEDVYGVGWLSEFREARSVIYRYTNSTWIRCDTTAIPFRIATIIGEDPGGRLYFEDTANETIVLDRGAARTVTSAAARHVAAAVSVSTVGMNTLRTEFMVRRTSMVRLALYSPDGRLVRHLLTEWCRPGRYSKTFKVTGAPGICIVRFHSAEGSAVSRFVRW